MNAKEMFEELGYKRVDGNNTINYKKYDEYSIHFDLDDKEYNIDHRSQDTPSYNLITWIYLDLHKAIQKQIEELGW